MKTIELNGLKFRVEVEHDSGMGAPWEEHDGHGIVSEWVTRDKRAGERVLATDGQHHRYYDITATMKLALADGWGIEGSEGKTKRQIAALAVDADFAHLQAWCNDEWYWVSVGVELLDVDGHTINHQDCREYLGGIESDSGDYLDDVANDLAREIAARVGDRTEFCLKIRNEGASHA